MYVCDSFTTGFDDGVCVSFTTGFDDDDDDDDMGLVVVVPDHCLSLDFVNYSLLLKRHL